MQTGAVMEVQESNDGGFVMEIRKANRDDIDRLVTGRIDFLQGMQSFTEDAIKDYEKRTREYMEKHLPNESMVAWLALEEGAIIATAFVCFYDVLPLRNCPSGKIGTIYNVSTHPDYRRRGIATQLLKQLIQDAKERGVGKLYLTATDMGKPLYEKLGFETLTRDMAYQII